MNLFKKEYLILDLDCKTQNEAFIEISKLAKKMGITNNYKKLVQGFKDREKESSTGFEDGFAIPHARIKEIIQPAIIFVKFKNGVDWNSIDGQLTKIAIALLVPADKANELHLTMLASIAKKLIDPSVRDSLKKANSFKKINDILFTENTQTETTANLSSNDKKLMIGITACTAGIAHTYMAEKALIDTGTKMGYKVRIETQGSIGVENKLTDEEISKADFVLIATDIKVDLSRFEGKKIYTVNVKRTLQNTESLITEASEKAEINNNLINREKNTKDLGKKLKGTNAKNFGKGILRHVMSGISYMIPLLVASGILIGIAKISMLIAGGNAVVPLIDKFEDFHASIYGENGWLQVCFVLNQIGGLGLSLIYVIFAIFVAYSIADKPGIIPGFFAGFMAIEDKITTLLPEIRELFPPGAYPYVDLPSGFLGAMMLAFLAGYLVKFLNAWIKVGKNFKAIKPMLILPAIGSLIVIVVGLFAFNPIFGLLNQWLKNVVTGTTSIAIVYALVISALTAFDLGGPVNKAAGTIAIPLAADGILPLTARVLSIIIPAFGVGLSTLLDKYVVGRRVYDKDLTVAGRTDFGLGFLAIGEGGLPFLFKNPILTIPINMLGAMLGSVLAVVIGAEQWYPLPAIWGWPLVEGNIWGYYVGLLSGVLFICFANIYIRWFLIKTKRMTIDNNDVWRKKTKEEKEIAKQLKNEKRVLKKENAKNQPKLPIRIKNKFITFHKWTVKSLKRTFSND